MNNLKLEKLSIKNLNSIGQADINFDESPLKDKPLFLISGPTGAGKTTLLDAICLALYNSTPRTNNTNKGIYLRNGKEAQQSNPQQMLREGTKEGSVELRFTGINGKRYLAHWEVAIKRTGNFAPTVWTLENLTDHVVLKNQGTSKDTQYLDTEITEKAVGLGFDDFCRTTMLAQGEFSKFLQSKDDEKSQILEKLMDSGIYRKIGMRIAEKEREKLNEKTKIADSIENISILTDEEVAQKQQLMQQLKLEVKQLETELNAINGKVSWLTRLNELTAGTQQATTALEKTKQDMAADSYLTEQKDMDDWDASTSARTTLLDIDKDQRQLDELNGQEKTLRQKAYNLNNERCLHMARQNARAKRKKELDLQLSALPDNEKAMLEQSGVIEEHLNTLLSKQKMLDDANDQLQRLQQEKAQHDKELATATARLTAAEADNRQAKAAAEAALHELEELDKEKPQMQFNSIKLLQQQLDNLGKIIADLNKNKTDSENEQKNVNDYQERLPALQQTANDALTACNAAKNKLETLTLSRNELLDELRKKLHKGDRCPLCGQPVTDDGLHHADEMIPDSLLDDARKKVEQAETCRKKADNELASAENSLKMYKGNLDTCLNNEKTTLQEFENYLQKLKEGIESDGMGISFKISPENGATEICQLKANLELKAKQLNTQIEQIDDKQKEEKRLQKQKDNVQTRLDDAARLCANAQKAIEGDKLNAEKFNTSMETAKTDIDKTTATMNQLMQGTDWKTELGRQGSKFITSLHTKAQQYKTDQKELERIGQELKTSQLLIDDATSACQTIMGCCPDWNLTTPDLSLTEISAPPVTPLEDVKKVLTDLVSDIRVWQDGKKTRNASIEGKNKELANFIATHPQLDRLRVQWLADNLEEKTVQQLKSEHKKMEQRLNAEQTTLSNISAELAQHTTRKPAFTDEDPDDLKSQQERAEKVKVNSTELNRNIGQLLSELDSNRKNAELIGDKQAELDRLTKEYEVWRKLGNDFGDKEGKTFSRIANSYLLRHLLQNANLYLRQFDARYSLMNTPPDMNILISDGGFNGAQRPNTGLSGGENFMVSLALALGLSKMSGNVNSHSSDVLFIDEGFGTLDENSLDHVMNCLESLQSNTGKRVGIISHREGLADRIDTHIEVIAKSETLSEVKVCQQNLRNGK